MGDRVTNEQIAKWHARINAISDICNTTVAYDNMSKDEIIDLFTKALHHINALATYPDEETNG